MNGSPHGGAQGSPQVTPENYRGKMDQWRQQASAGRKDYEPQARQQIQSQFQEYSPPLYASIVGYKRDWNLLVAQSRLSGFAATLGRDFSDAEAKAITEYTLQNIHANAACKWATVGLAGYMTYRGRNTWQFPFYRPKLGGRFNPSEASSLFSNKKVRGLYPNLIWHTMRFLSYAVVTSFMVEPIFKAVNHIWTQQDMMKDSRLEQFTKDASRRVEQVLSKGPPQASPRHESSEDDSQNDYTFSQQQIEQQPSSGSSDSSASTNSWYNPVETTRARERTQQHQAQTRDDWDVLDDDDASPVSSPSRATPRSTVSGGSSWDRLRQQSQPNTQQAEYGSSSGWSSSSNSQTQQSQGGWGESGRSQDSYSHSSSDQDKGPTKDQAQAEFDRLVERERGGIDQEKTWGKR